MPPRDTYQNRLKWLLIVTAWATFALSSKIFVSILTEYVNYFPPNFHADFLDNWNRAGFRAVRLRSTEKNNDMGDDVLPKPPISCCVPRNVSKAPLFSLCVLPGVWRNSTWKNRSGGCVLYCVNYGRSLSIGRIRVGGCS